MLENPPRNRDGQGRFVPGHALAGPGRKPREIEKQYLLVMEEVTDLDIWRRIVERATLDACNGNARARSWLSDYLLGQPVARVQAVQEDETPFERILRQLREHGDAERGS